MKKLIKKPVKTPLLSCLLGGVLLVTLPASAAFRTGQVGGGSFTAAAAATDTDPHWAIGTDPDSNPVMPADAAQAAAAFANDISLSVSAGDALAFADTNSDGTVDTHEFVLALSAAASLNAVNTAENGIYARAYASEIAQLSQLTATALQAAIDAGNSWAVNVPVVANSNLALSDNGEHTQSLGIIDAAGLSVASGGLVQTSYIVTHSEGADASNKFSIDDTGNVVLASGVTFADLSPGSYTIALQVDDDNAKSYQKTATVTVALSLSNEAGCILNTNIQASDFSVLGGNPVTQRIAEVRVTIVNGNNDDRLFIKNNLPTKSADRWTWYNVSGGAGSTYFNNVTAIYDQSELTLTLAHNVGLSVAKWGAAFAQVGYLSVADSPPARRELSFFIGSQIPYEINDVFHYYEYVAANKIHWSTASFHAANKRLYGLQGYLATIVTAAENSFIQPKLEGQGWIGLSDRRFERYRYASNWEWRTGPEAGQRAVYTNWSAGEPNNAPGIGCTPYELAQGEDFVHYYSDNGKWNDYCMTSKNITGYYVEYGGLELQQPDLTETMVYNLAQDGVFCSSASVTD